MTCRHIPKNSGNWSSRFGTIWLDDLELLGCRTRRQAVQRSPGHAYLDAEREKIINYLEFSTSALRTGRYPPTGGEFYSGQQWWILDRGVAEHIVNAYSDDPEYWQTLALCRIPDEVLIQTIVGRFLKPDDIGPSQTFMSFDHPEKGRPAVWDVSDYEKLMSTEKLFARKVSWQQSEALVRDIFRTI